MIIGNSERRQTYWNTWLNCENVNVILIFISSENNIYLLTLTYNEWFSGSCTVWLSEYDNSIHQWDSGFVWYIKLSYKARVNNLQSEKEIWKCFSLKQGNILFIFHSLACCLGRPVNVVASLIDKSSVGSVNIQNFLKVVT